MRTSALSSFAAAVAGLCLLGCSERRDNADVGRVSVALSLPDGVTINSVAWAVFSAANSVLASGTVNTGAPKATASVNASVPAGLGETVTMSTTTSQGTACSGTSAPFDVAPGQVVAVPVTIVCGNTAADAGASGALAIKGTVVAGDACPVLTAWTISPAEAAAGGGQIDLSITATDADDGNAAVHYAWSATAGSFADPAAPLTQYVCGPAGRQTLSVVISDQHVPTPCTLTVTFPPVDCL